jgi:hypothetical protein
MTDETNDNSAPKQQGYHPRHQELVEGALHTLEPHSGNGLVVHIIQHIILVVHIIQQ